MVRLLRPHARPTGRRLNKNSGFLIKEKAQQKRQGFASPGQTSGKGPGASAGLRVGSRRPAEGIDGNTDQTPSRCTSPPPEAQRKWPLIQSVSCAVKSWDAVGRQHRAITG